MIQVALGWSFLSVSGPRNVPSLLKIARAISDGGVAQDSINYGLKCAALAAGAETSFLMIISENRAQITNCHGLPLAAPRSWEVPSGVETKFSVPFISDNFLEELEIEGIASPFKVRWNYIVSVPLRLKLSEDFAILVCANVQAKSLNQGWSLELVKAAAGMLRNTLLLVDELLTLSELGAKGLSLECAVTEPPAVYQHGAGSTENPSLLSAFLDETLIRRHKVISKKNVSYHGVRTWRLPIKDTQLSALKLLKSTTTPYLENRIADDIIVLVEQIVGSNAFSFVTNVPCGNSGSGCLAQRIATSIGLRLGLPYQKVFDDLPVTGASHPKRNATRPSMRLAAEPKGSALLIDDVATSGSHLSEACSLLRASGIVTLPIAWIAC
ncbi:MAG: hypothetical protein ACRCUE_07190 [Bosea sp. (in: a-proteobacteria)]